MRTRIAEVNPIIRVRSQNGYVNPPTLGNVTRRAIETGYFASPKEGTQYKLFQKWKDGILADCIKGDDRLCLQAITDEERLKSPLPFLGAERVWSK